MAGMNVVMSTAAPTARELRQSEELVKVSDAAPPPCPSPISTMGASILTCNLASLRMVAPVASDRRIGTSE